MDSGGVVGQLGALAVDQWRVILPPHFRRHPSCEADATTTKAEIAMLHKSRIVLFSIYQVPIVTFKIL